MKNKKWLLGWIIGTIFGILVSASGYFLQQPCLLTPDTIYCYVIDFFQVIAYLPSMYLFLPVYSYTPVFMQDNPILTLILLVIPVLQYGMIGSVIMIVYNEFKSILEKKKEE